jgi:hypothetical protein
MQWKPEKYGGIQTIRVPPNQVWTPDVNHRKSVFFSTTYSRKMTCVGCFI